MMINRIFFTDSILFWVQVIFYEAGHGRDFFLMIIISSKSDLYHSWYFSLKGEGGFKRRNDFKN